MSKALLFALPLLFTACETTSDSPPPVDEPPGSLDVDVTLLDFGTLDPGASESHSVSLSNLGEGTLEIWDVTFQDDRVRAHWSVEGTLTGPLDPGESRVLSVTFAPRTVGDLPAELKIVSDDPDDPEHGVVLVGACSGTPQLGLSSTTVDFDEVVLGNHLELDLWFSNWGTGDLTLDSVALANPDDPTFELIVDPTGTILAPGEENGLAVIRFTPVYNGAWYGSLFVESNDPANPEVQVTLVGRGVTP
ncbi:MAG: choice-of-anchor D domain-containing protein [Deltaproteobacteria bacterium]|nr:choice-of-anchor D domain-containing protein [Deltaproteobacteria bacterium]